MSVNKYVKSSAIEALQYEPVFPKGAQEGEEYVWSGSYQVAATPNGEPKKLKVWKPQETGPSAEPRRKGTVPGSPDSCLLPNREKCYVPHWKYLASFN